MSVSTLRKLAVGGAAVALGLTLAACSNDTSTNAEASAPPPAATADAGDGGVVDIAAASAFLEPFKQVGEFPISDPLTEKPAAGSKVVFLRAATSTSGLQDDSLRAAAEALGMEYSSIEVGVSAETTTAALDSVVEMKPDAVVNVAIDPTLFSAQLDKLRENGAVVVSGGIVNGDQFGFDTVVADSADVQQTGKIMAAQALVDGGGEVTSLVYYKTPELAFTTEMERGVADGVKEFCPSCELRVVNIPIMEVGTTAADRIVSDLQANPQTGAALASFDEIYIGLPAALDTAGLQMYTAGQAPVESTYQNLEDGKHNATVAWDIDMMMWALMDQVAREMTGQAVPSYQQDGLLTKQVITAENLPPAQDRKDGWTAYPDYADRFKALWAVQ